jgi:hypothetical protein
VSVGREDRDPAPSRNVLLGAGALTRPAGHVRRPARQAEPSWGRVLVNTVKLSVLRQLRAAGLRRERFPGLACPSALALGYPRPGPGRRRGDRPVAYRRPDQRPFPGCAGAGGRRWPPSAAAGPQAQAAAWIAGQVSGSAIVACNPGMCAALQEQGVAAGRLMPLRTAAASPRGAGVLVTSRPADGQLAGRYAPALIASFGSGGNRVEVRAVVPGGAAAYHAALRADLAVREAAGSQLLRNSHIRFTGPGAAQLRAGEVDTRLLATLAALASQYSFGVTGFGDAGPGAPVLFRQVAITGIGRGLPAALAMVRAQNPPYLPAHAAVAGQTGLNIEFAAPSPLGLLSPVLDTDSPHPAAAGGAFPVGWAQIR